MKTPDKIKIWLETEIAVHYHLPNPEPRLAPKEFMYLEKMHGETLAYIERLEADNESKKKRINELESSLAQAERERDAAVADLKDGGDCRYCKNIDLSDNCGCGNCCTCINEECPCCKCDRANDHFEWRGVCEENTNDKP